MRGRRRPLGPDRAPRAGWCALGLAALTFLTPRFFSSDEATDQAQQPTRSLSAWARFALYVGALVLAMFLAFFAGVAHFEATQCGGPDGEGECDVAGLEGILWAGATLLLGVIVIVTAEVSRAYRRVARRLDGISA